ncbi:hypothetical protein MMC30_001623 [Trapelia coarctata]|nr:hypothetical protein [Trapelia coarctata]
MSKDLQPQLPQGDFSVLSTLSQSLSFHSSPESFISSRIQHAALQKAEQDEGQAHVRAGPQVVRARILGRNVAVVSSHQLCKDVLSVGSGISQSTVTAAVEGESIGPSTFVAQPAYKELMADFFPPPNILLEDLPTHEQKRNAWNEHLQSFTEDSTPVIRQIVVEHIGTWSNGGNIDLYESMKDLSWLILLGVFLQLGPKDKEFGTVESLQETLLRGQFSLFPVSINTPLWRSSRSKGIDARRKLQTLLKSHLGAESSGCPLLRTSRVERDDIVANALLFTSSIAVKALSSLLTASLLNIFLHPSEPSLASRIRSEGATNGPILLDSILLETERLSPPVVGVMRRVQQDIILASPEGQPPNLVPRGWDIWLYFVGAGRDKDVYPLPNKFLPERFISPTETGPGFAFGSGAKTCLGMDITRQIVRTVAATILEAGIELEGEVKAEGVRGWLGWNDSAAVDAFAKDLKQLPCQRPKDPIRLRIRRDNK